jgi:hypothetical protein
VPTAQRRVNCQLFSFFFVTLFAQRQQRNSPVRPLNPDFPSVHMDVTASAAPTGRREADVLAIPVKAIRALVAPVRGGSLFRSARSILRVRRAVSQGNRRAFQ